MKQNVDVVEFDKNFLEKQMEKARDANKNIKEELADAQSEYDLVYN